MQMKHITKKLPNGNTLKIQIRWDDSCNNGHRTFAITGDEVDSRGEFVAGGCIHEEIAEAAPELAPYIKWHLCSEHQPLHFVANTEYWAKKGKLSFARNCAIWPEATDEDLLASGLEQRLMDRLPGLMAEFRKDIESLGFLW
jgi:hypothetical protein